MNEQRLETVLNRIGEKAGLEDISPLREAAQLGSIERERDMTKHMSFTVSLLQAGKAENALDYLLRILGESDGYGLDSPAQHLIYRSYRKGPPNP